MQNAIVIGLLIGLGTLLKTYNFMEKRNLTKSEILILYQVPTSTVPSSLISIRFHIKGFFLGLDRVA